MEITIKGKNLEVPDELELYTQRKLTKLTKYSPRLLAAAVNFTEGASKKRERSHRVEVVLNVPGQRLRSEEEKESFYIAVDSAVDKLKRQLKKMKTKRVDKAREKPGITEVISAQAEQTEKPSAAGPMIFIESFSVKPMTTTEAVLQLQMSDRDFMLFVNDQSVINGLYKREKDNYLLLVPEGQTE